MTFRYNFDTFETFDFSDTFDFWYMLVHFGTFWYNFSKIGTFNFIGSFGFLVFLSFWYVWLLWCIVYKVIGISMLKLNVKMAPEMSGFLYWLPLKNLDRNTIFIEKF